MNVPPTARILAWRKMDGLPPPDEVRALALKLADALERAIGTYVVVVTTPSSSRDGEGAIATSAAAGAARICYDQGDRPVVSAKLQDFFGVTATPPLVGERVRAKVCLLSPAQRPVAVTDDLARVWKEGYPLVRKEMRGRYPKHDWPESV